MWLKTQGNSGGGEYATEYIKKYGNASPYTFTPIKSHSEFVFNNVENILRIYTAGGASGGMDTGYIYAYTPPIDLTKFNSMIFDASIFTTNSSMTNASCYIGISDNTSNYTFSSDLPYFVKTGLPINDKKIYRNAIDLTSVSGSHRIKLSIKRNSSLGYTQEIDIFNILLIDLPLTY